MTQAVKNIAYRQPLLGNSTTNPLYTEDGAGVTESGNTTTLVADMSSRQLLEGILIELKKLNLRQDEVFEEIVNDEDIEPCE